VDYGLTGFFICTSPQLDATRAAILQTRDVRDFVGTLEQQAANASGVPIRQHGKIFDQQMRRRGG
jgi:hypothetical protein